MSRLLQAFESDLLRRLIKLHKECSQQPGQQGEVQHKCMLIGFYQREELTKTKPAKIYFLESTLAIAGKTDPEIKAIAMNLHAFVISLIMLAAQDLSTFKAACEAISQDKADTIISLKQDFNHELVEIDASRKRFLESCTFDIDAFNNGMRTENLLRFLVLVAVLGFLYFNINNKTLCAVCMSTVSIVFSLACIVSNGFKNNMKSAEVLIRLISSDSLLFVNEILALQPSVRAQPASHVSPHILRAGHFGGGAQNNNGIVAAELRGP
ncbi:MAG: hypothetical protein V4496_06075 [Pseudomonadota bacterium]